MPNKNPLIAAIAGVSFAAALAGCGQGGAAGNVDPDASLDEVDPIELTFSDIQPDASTAGQFRIAWMERVTELTDGKVTFKFHGNSTLHPGEEAISAVQSSLTDITIFSHGYWPDQLPVANWDDEAIQQSTWGLGYPVADLVGAPAEAAHYEDGGAVTEEMASQGFVPLLPMFSSPNVLTCTEPFETPADLEGRQVRVSSDVVKAEAEALGMTGTFLDPTEQYEALQRGVLDCAINAGTTVTAMGILDVAPYTAMLDQPSGLAHYGISKEVWDAQPDVVKDAMEQARNEAMVEFIRLTLDGFKNYIKASDEAGGEIIDPTALDAELSEFRESQPDITSRAPSGVSDPEAEVASIQTHVDAWTEFVEDELGIPAGAPANIDDMLKALSAGSAVVKDWDAYLEHLNEYMASS